MTQYVGGGLAVSQGVKCGDLRHGDVRPQKPFESARQHQNMEPLSSLPGISESDRERFRALEKMLNEAPEPEPVEQETVPGVYAGNPYFAVKGEA